MIFVIKLCDFFTAFSLFFSNIPVAGIMNLDQYLFFRCWRQAAPAAKKYILRIMGEGDLYYLQLVLVLEYSKRKTAG